MPLNLLKNYNTYLDIAGLSHGQRKTSLEGVFSHNFIAKGTPFYRGRKVTPTPLNGLLPMETLFRHLTTVIIDKKTRQRDFDIERSKRLHWVRFHLDLKKQNNMLVFSVKEPEGNRTYIFDEDENYVIVLEPKPTNIYFLLSAYYLQGRDAARNKIHKKYKRRLSEIL